MSSSAGINLKEIVERLNTLPTILPPPSNSAVIRQELEDFEVEESLSFELTGEGEHLYLWVEKRGCNTDWLARQFQECLKRRSQDIGYAGKKDRYSVSRQWFSVHLPGIADDEVIPKLKALESESLKILKTARHNKKLRMGALSGNRFKIKLRELTSEISASHIERLSKQGFPNYYGYQRFGHQFSNVSQAYSMLAEGKKIKSRNKRSMYLSAARSMLFNFQLAHRISAGEFNNVLMGDCLMRTGSNGYFVCDLVDQAIRQRHASGEIHPSGWLVGKQNSQTQAKAQELEYQALADYSDWVERLQSQKLDSSRRALRVIPKELSLQAVNHSEVVIAFSLPSGSFATSLLSELANIRDLQLRRDNDA